MFHFLDIRLGIDAGPVGSFVQNADHRDRIAVHDAAGQVELTGHGHNGLRAVLHDDPPGQRSAGRHGDLDLMLICHLDQLLDLTVAAPFAVSDIPGNPDLAVEILNAVGKKNQYLVGRRAMAVGSNQMIVHLDEGLLHASSRDPDQFPNQDHERKQASDPASQLVRKEDVLASQDGQDKK